MALTEVSGEGKWQLLGVGSGGSEGKLFLLRQREANTGDEGGQEGSGQRDREGGNEAPRGRGPRRTAGVGAAGFVGMAGGVPPPGYGAGRRRPGGRAIEW